MKDDLSFEELAEQEEAKAERARLLKNEGQRRRYRKNTEARLKVLSDKKRAYRKKLQEEKNGKANGV